MVPPFTVSQRRRSLGDAAASHLPGHWFQGLGSSFFVLIEVLLATDIVQSTREVTLYPPPHPATSRLI